MLHRNAQTRFPRYLTAWAWQKTPSIVFVCDWFYEGEALLDSFCLFYHCWSFPSSIILRQHDLLVIASMREFPRDFWINPFKPQSLTMRRAKTTHSFVTCGTSFAISHTSMFAIHQSTIDQQAWVPTWKIIFD